MTREDFFKKIKNESGTNESYITELLKLRGFIFEERMGDLILSDNSHYLDNIYLMELFIKYNLGHIVDNEIIIHDIDCTEFINNEFQEYNQIARPSVYINRDWRWFKNRKHGSKAAVLWLEPFIARYIKAISSCCVQTVGSCDGNHPNENKMYIMTEGEGSIPWHRLICEKCLISKFDIEWSEDYTAMQFSVETKYDTYYALNKAAEYLYANRKEIRKIKDMAFAEISNSYMRHHSSKEIEKEFLSRASTFFDISSLQ